MPRRPRAIPILTEEQRSAIRMGWRSPGKYAEGEMEREHDQRIADRSAVTGLPINSRPLLNSTDTWLSRYRKDMRTLQRLSKVPQRAPAVEEPQLTSG